MPLYFKQDEWQKCAYIKIITVQYTAFELISFCLLNFTLFDTRPEISSTPWESNFFVVIYLTLVYKGHLVRIKLINSYLLYLTLFGTRPEIWSTPLFAKLNLVWYKTRSWVHSVRIELINNGGARGVMVIVIGNGHGDTSSNPGQDGLHFT